MATPVQVNDAQQALLDGWARGTEFELDIYDSPKRQFNVLAKLLGWVGGEEPWNAKWLEAFDEVYIWRAPSINFTGPTFMSDTAIASDSATPTASDNSGSASNHGSNIWSKFDGFEPDHGASFNKEFRRLCRHMKWDKEERHLHRAELFEADFESHYGKDVGDIKKWQEFCRLCSIDPIPETITECVEALEVIYVNIYDVLDHQRTGEPILPFDNFDDFVTYTLEGRMYPVEKAKGDTFLPVFLKELFRRHFSG